MLVDNFEQFSYPKFLTTPLAIYGDFHGDSASMLHAVENNKFKLLLGDYVDRGADGVFCL